MDKIKAYLTWLVILMMTLIFLELAATGRLGLLVSVAFLPDNVAVVKSS